MPSSMLIHDRRLAGNPPGDMADNTYEVDENIPITHALGWIAEYSRRSGGLSDLYVMCHGYEGTLDLRHLTCVNEEHGGFGLQLCDEGLSLANATLTAVLRGKVTKITIFSCATADTAPYNKDTEADGMRFCGEIALWTRAEVIAAVETQKYNRRRTIWQWLTFSNRAGAIDFGAWEGPVYSFTPADPGGRKILSSPKGETNFLQVPETAITGGFTVEVRAGDPDKSSLSGIAKAQYGDFNLWPLIFDLNKGKIGPNPNRIGPGAKLLLLPIDRYTPAELADARRRAPAWSKYPH
ncbi:MAG: hypothetical protein WB763_22230 [Terriglobia bacterium]|jgi:hypothetical protein